MILKLEQINKNASFFPVASHLPVQSRPAWHFSDARGVLPLRPVPSSLCCWNKVVIHLGWVRTVSLKVEVELHWKHSFSSPPFSTHLFIPSSLNMGSFLCFCPPPLCFAFQTYGKPGVPGAERPYSDQDDLKEPEWVGSEETGTWWQQCPIVPLGRPQGIVTEKSK